METSLYIMVLYVNFLMFLSSYILRLPFSFYGRDRKQGIQIHFNFIHILSISDIRPCFYLTNNKSIEISFELFRSSLILSYGSSYEENKNQVFFYVLSCSPDELVASFGEISQQKNTLCSPGGVPACPGLAWRG